MPRSRIDGTDVIVGRTRVDLRFLRTFRTLRNDGTSEPRVRAYCHGCRRMKTIEQLGLRVTEEGDGRVVVDLQSNCHECRVIMNARRT
jgi:hypothetical protein